MTIRVGTRGSALALVQARAIAEQLAAITDEAVEIITVRTEGDRSTASLATIGGTGVFASALRESLIAEKCDLVVHSYKDLPVEPYNGLTVAGVPEREDPRDALCARDGLTIETLPIGARVGTGSPRRAAQLRSHRPDLAVIDIRGNVGTRLGKVSSGELDAVVLAAAGLSRLDRAAAITELFDLETWPTAAGQGALALEVRSAEAAPRNDSAASPTILGAAVAAIAVPMAWTAVDAERRVLGGLEAGCAAPIGVASSIHDGQLELWASVYRPDGAQTITRSLRVSFDRDTSRAVALEMSDTLVAELLEAGAAELAPLGANR